MALALFALALLTTNIFLGLRIGGFNDQFGAYSKAAREVEESTRESAARERAEKQLMDRAELLAVARSRKTLHFLFGLAGSLVTILVSSVSVTYFIGTSRWCREVVETYRLDPELAERSRLLKRRVFPPALVSMASILAIIALGASADPSVSFDRAAAFVVPHYAAAIVGVAAIAWAFFVQLGLVAANYEIIDKIVADVATIRRQKGLD